MLSLLVAVGFLVLFAPVTVGGATSYILVSGSSMRPTYSDGDLVVVRRGEYAVGEIVAFRVDNGVVIHRIVGGTAEEGFVMRGDNKEQPDPWHPTPADIIGEHFAQIPDGGRWVQRITGSPVVLGITAAGLGTLMLWSPVRRLRRGAHLPSGAHARARGPRPVSTMRSPGPALLIIAALTGILAGVFVYFSLRPPQRLEEIERVEYEHTSSFAYTAVVDPSVVYGSTMIHSPPDGSPPTPIYAQLLDELRVRFNYAVRLASPSGLTGVVSAELRVGTGGSLWTRTIPLIEGLEFEGTTVSAEFPVDIDRVRSMVSRAEEQTGYYPGVYQLQVMARVVVDDLGRGRAEVFVAEFPMELQDMLLVVTNDLIASEEVTVAEKVLVDNDLKILGLSLPVPETRAFSGSLLALLLIGGGIYAVALRRRLGKGELGRIRLRYGSMLVPVTSSAPNGGRPVEVSSMADLVRLARRAEQMVFYDRRAPGEHWFVVPDGPVTYVYHLSDADGGPG